MHARGLQFWLICLATKIVQYFDSCMREDCNPRITRTRTSRRFWFMHVRGLQFILHDKDTNEDDFDSCMREDCNSKYAQISVLISVHSYDFFLWTTIGFGVHICDFAVHMFYASVILWMQCTQYKCEPAGRYMIACTSPGGFVVYTIWLTVTPAGILDISSWIS